MIDLIKKIAIDHIPIDSARLRLIATSLHSDCDRNINMLLNLGATLLTYYRTVVPEYHKLLTKKREFTWAHRLRRGIGIQRGKRRK
jgi:hypothetical protein